MKIDSLWISQADYVFVYELPNPRDRDKIAENIGYPPAKLHEACEETRRRGPYWFLLWDARRHHLFRMPPMPETFT